MLDILFPSCIIETIDVLENKLIFKARSSHTEASCPACKTRSDKVHGYYQRQPHDLPLADYQLQFCLRVKRFCCLNHSCERTTFAASFEPWLARYAHRSKRLSEKQSCVAMMLSAKASEDLLTTLQLPISHDTALNLVRKQVIELQETPRVLGVDDFAIRKRKSYGTLLLDLEKHKVIDVLPDRASETLIDWLKVHPGIEIVSRDRSQEYKSACDEGAPQAIQVADRWHLYKNLGDVLKRWFERHKKHLVEPSVQAEEVPTSEAIRSLNAQTSFERALQTKLNTRHRRLALFAEAKRLKEEGFSSLYIANQLKMGRSTLNRWFSKHGFPDKQKKRMLEPEPYLKQRWEAGITNKMQLYREIVSQGFTGSHTLVYLYFTELEAGLDPATNSKEAKKQVVKRYTAFQATRIFTCPPETLAEQDKRRLERLFATLKEAELCYDLVQRFIALFKRQDQEADETMQAFGRWLGDAETSGITELVRLAKGFSNDQTAIEAALTLPWSNGQTEGKVTKLKYLKRQMYGRANFDLLRQKVLLAA